MAVDLTVQGIFDKAMYLIDANNEYTGSTETTDTKEYKVKTIGILNSLLDLVYPYSSNYLDDETEGRPFVEDLQEFTDAVPMDAYICRSVLPYGLAARLLSSENAALSNYFQELFEEALEKAKRSMRASIGEVEDLYGGIEHGEFGSWSRL